MVIGNSVTTMGDMVFANCSSHLEIYYKGTAEDWADIDIPLGFGNSNLTNATKYYYSEEEPATEGNYWHYDENGNVVVW